MPTKSSIKVGDVLIYRSTEWPGSQYQTRKVVGETTRSWLIMSMHHADMWQHDNPERWAEKLPKTLKGYEIGTAEQAAKKLWASSNLSKIRQQLDWLYDADKIIAIAQVLGYPIPEEINGKTSGTETGNSAPQSA